jgi:hypothetical protein
MGTVVLFVVVVAALAGVLVWLMRANRNDAAHLAQALGLEVVPKGAVTKDRDPLMGQAQDQPIARGQVSGWDVTLARRTVFRGSPKVPRNRSLQTVLLVQLPRPPHALVRIDPAYTGALAAGAVDAIGHYVTIGSTGPSPAVDWPTFTTGDDTFDRFHRSSAPDPVAAASLLPPSVRTALLAARTAATGSMPDNTAGRAVGGLVAPSFAVEAQRAVCTCNGTPTARLTGTLQAALPALAHLAHAAVAPRP